MYCMRDSINLLTDSSTEMQCGTYTYLKQLGRTFQETSIKFGTPHDCTAICKLRQDNVERKMRTKFKEQLKASRQVDAVTAALQASRQRHTLQHSELRSLEARLAAAESSLTSALAAQRKATSQQAEVRDIAFSEHLKTVTQLQNMILAAVSLLAPTWPA